MKSLPPKLLEMTMQGSSEEEIQYIFDALVHAEEQGQMFVNVYQAEEVSFLFTNDRAQADQQCRKWVQHRGDSVLGFHNTGDTWELR